MRKFKIFATVLVVFIMAAIMSFNFYVSASGTAVLIDIDKTTRGNWPGNYGTEGHIIISGNPAHQNIPAYADITFENEWGGGPPSFWTWWDQDNDGLWGDSERLAPGALFKTPQRDSRIAACYYSGGVFTVTVDVGNEVRVVSLYMHDYDEWSRTALVYALNEDHSDYIIEPIEIEGYEAGWYLRFQITGRVQFSIEDTGPMNACLSGVFLDPADSDIIFPGQETAQTGEPVAGSGIGTGNEGGAEAEIDPGYSHDPFYGHGENQSIFDGEFIMVLSLLGIIYIVLLLGAASLTSRIVDKINQRKAA
jgi:hypothetical protein